MSFFGASGLGIEKEGFDVSRDGRRLVYVSETRGGYYLVTHELGTSEFVLKEGDAGAAQPAFSPDGSNIVYKAEGQIWVVPFESGTPVPIASESDGHAVYWSNDNWIYWADIQGTVLRRVRPNGAGGPEEVYRGERNVFLNKGLEENDLLLGNGWENILTHLDSNGSERVVSQRGGSAQLVDSDIVVSTALGNLRAGHLGWADEGNVDDSRIFRSGVRTGSLSGISHFQITDSGTLFYAAGASAGLTRLVIRNPDGATNELSFDAAYHGSMDATRDGSVVIVDLYDGSERTMLYNVERGTTDILFSEIRSERPILNSSGSRITFSQSDPDGSRILRQEANSSRAPEIIFQSENYSIPYDWSRDERFLLFGEATDTSQVIKVLDTSNSSVTTVFETDNSTWSPKFSPDESMITYTVVGSRGSEVFAEPFPASGGKRWNVSGEFGGEEPEWREDTNQLIFRSGDSWYSASYSDERDGFERPELLFSGPYVNIGGVEYRVLDGGRILLQESVAKERTTNRIEVITGFIDHVRRELGDSD
jgi:Tol biopolymer transport system component